MAKESENGRFRKKRVNFSIVSNEVIRDDTISLKAKGLYSLIQSYITLDGFTLYKGFLKSKCREGKKAFNSAWNELKDSGYLLQYRMQEPETKKFFYEYELLDQKQAITPKGGNGYNNPIPQKGYNGLGGISVREYTENGETNNTDKSNTNENNIYQVISYEDVTEQIDISQFPFSMEDQAREIALLITDIYNLPDEATIRVSGIARTAKEVKDRFRLLDHYHIEYVIEEISKTSTTVSNKRNYLITAIYNAPTTLSTHYQILVNTGM